MDIELFPNNYIIIMLTKLIIIILYYACAHTCSFTIIIIMYNYIHVIIISYFSNYNNLSL